MSAGRTNSTCPVLILRSRAKRGVSKDEGGHDRGRGPWFETRGFAALLTMRGES